MKKKGEKLIVDGVEVRLITKASEDYISLTDIAGRFEGNQNIYNWLRNKDTIEFLGLWERLHNPSFNPIEFERLVSEAGSNRFSLSPKKWIEETNAIGIQSKSGRYGGGTYAHEDIALEFCSWISPKFKLHLVTEYKRLKQKESLEWQVNRTLAKVNYRFHVDAVKTNLVPPRISKKYAAGIYANEADLLNLAMFGITARQWKQANPDLSGNLRDHASNEQLLVLANLETLNAEFIREGLEQDERLRRLNEIAIYQMKLLTGEDPFERMIG